MLFSSKKALLLNFRPERAAKYYPLDIHIHCYRLPESVTEAGSEGFL
jgi:hypothetical protein